MIRRTIATRAQSLGSVKDIHLHVRHSRDVTTANEYTKRVDGGLTIGDQPFPPIKIRKWELDGRDPRPLP